MDPHEREHPKPHPCPFISFFLFPALLYIFFLSSVRWFSMSMNVHGSKCLNNGISVFYAPGDSGAYSYPVLPRVMCTMRNPVFYTGLPCVTLGYPVLPWVAMSYAWLPGDTIGYLSVTLVTMCYPGLTLTLYPLLPWVTRYYYGLTGVTLYYPWINRIYFVWSI